MRRPLYHRRLVLLEPGAPYRGPTGQILHRDPTEHEVRGERRDLTATERVQHGLSAAEQVTRFLVRRGDLVRLPTGSWQLRDDREDRYDIESVNIADGRRDEDPHAVVTLLCAVTTGVS